MDFEIDLITFNYSSEKICKHCKNRNKCHPTHICETLKNVYWPED